MSVQTSLDQYFKLKLKNTRKIKSQNLVGLKELKRLKKVNIYKTLYFI